MPLSHKVSSTLRNGTFRSFLLGMWMQLSTVTRTLRIWPLCICISAVKDGSSRYDKVLYQMLAAGTSYLNLA